MKRFLTALFATLAIALGADAQGMARFDKAPLEIVTAGGRHRFQVELAISTEQMTQGLMFRREMAPDAGMLFLHDSEAERAMWMRNTYIPLDMLFIRADGRILRIATRTVPQSLATISSEGPAKAVLELNSGTAERLGIKPGDRVIYPGLGS